MSDDSKSAKDLLAEANSQIEQMSAADAVSQSEDENIVFVDVRETGEAEQGMIPGAEHAPRGMLEFYIDPASPAHQSVFAQGKKFVFYCGSGGRSALAGATARRMGLKSVAHIPGGFPAWKEAGGPVGNKS
jgi:rhodanese-related sulfurtransferase